MSDNRRLKLLSAHLSSHFQSSPTDDSLLKFLERTPSLNSKALFDCYFADMALGIQMYRKAMVASPKFDHLEEMEMTTEQIRERCIKQVKELCLVKTLSVEADLKEPIESGTIIYSAAEYDLALATRLVVSHGLYGDTLQTLGTQKHKIFLERIYKLKDIGSISITELGHGSNLSMLETIANYDHANREFIINSPTATSAKWWIGAVSKSANMTALFARLIVDSTDKGVHVFAVPIRNYETHEALPGVIIGDCGKKNGLNGVDNGYLLFKNYRVSYDSLLDKMSSINTEGKFKSSIKNNDKRLGTMLGGLLRGRLGTISGSEMNLRQALTIALRYAAVRRQFSSTSDEEIRLLDYQSHQYRLIPYLAKCVALRACVNKLWNSFKSVREKLLEDPECNELQEYHTILSALKGIAGKYSITGIQESRESTGGNGFSSYSSFNRLRNNQDMHLTWEGDSTVLAQQTGKYILKQIQRIYKGQKITNPTLQYLCIDPDLIRNYRAAFKTKEELLNENLLTELLEFRVNYCLQQSINRIQANASKYANITEAWNYSQVHYIQELVKAYGELIIAGNFSEFIKGLTQKCENTGNILKKLYYLYLIGIINQCISVYADSAITSQQANLIKDTELELILELRDYSLRIIDAIAAPDKLIGSVLGQSDGQVYSHIIKAIESNPECYSKPSYVDVIKDIRNSLPN